MRSKISILTLLHKGNPVKGGPKGTYVDGTKDDPREEKGKDEQKVVDEIERGVFLVPSEFLLRNDSVGIVVRVLYDDHVVREYGKDAHKVPPEIEHRRGQFPE